MYGYQNRQRLLLYTSLTDWFYNRGGKCLLRGTNWFLIYSRLRLVFKWLKDRELLKGQSALLADFCVEHKISFWACEKKTSLAFVLPSLTNETVEKYNYHSERRHDLSTPAEHRAKRTKHS